MEPNRFGRKTRHRRPYRLADGKGARSQSRSLRPPGRRNPARRNPDRVPGCVTVQHHPAPAHCAIRQKLRRTRTPRRRRYTPLRQSLHRPARARLRHSLARNHRPLLRPLRRLFGQNAWRIRASVLHGPDHAHFLVATLAALVFAWFSISSFVKAEQRSRKARSGRTTQ